MNYETETRSAYQSVARAAAYKRHQTREWSWARFATWREQRAVVKALRRYDWSERECVLDVPCGTGILSGALWRFPFRVVAADIAVEMMALGRSDYHGPTFRGFVQFDITRLPVRRQGCAAAIVLGFMHRVPSSVRQQALAELASVVSRVLIVSYSEDDVWQRSKRRLLRLLRPSYRPAPCVASSVEAEREVQNAGFVVRRRCHVVPLLSSDVLLVLEKRAPGGGDEHERT